MNLLFKLIVKCIERSFKSTQLNLKIRGWTGLSLHQPRVSILPRFPYLKQKEVYELSIKIPYNVKRVDLQLLNRICAVVESVLSRF